MSGDGLEFVIGQAGGGFFDIESIVKGIDGGPCR